MKKNKDQDILDLKRIKATLKQKKENPKYDPLRKNKKFYIHEYR